MPISSTQIATLNGAFTQQYAQQQAFSQGIQPPSYNVGGYNTGAQNEGMAGRALNTATAVGAPMATLGMGLLGVDPISMGVKYGMSAGASGGMGAGLAVGAGVAGIGMLGVGAVGYMGNQMMQGAQQSQQFNQGMRSSFAFANPYGQHGRGFSEGDIHQIGGSLRGMAAGGMGGAQFGGTSDQFQLGPSFAELGRLAANMGRMGLADGVRNAKEFTDKFKEMMKSVKSIAEDMGATLEEAQKTMASMKGSGVFGRQAGVSHAIRAAAVGGGLATTEVTGMMNIGSQISRMFGGTGRQGAMGGIKAIENVGAAIQTGVLSEEDIYQATGLTGAEGRQAMAQQGLLQTGSFLKSSKGRWLVASLAGKNGQLDASSVADFMSGGMGVNDTRGAAHRNLRGVGRANFIRNEGRLRGAVMEQFGDMAPAMAMMGWAQGKGIDINSMGDREMLFLQRQMGLGRDEADALVKRAKALPQLMEHLRESKVEDTFSREHGMRAQGSGIEGIKRKLEAARDQVNNSMQKVGQDILNSTTDMIAEWGNKIAGVYEEREIEVQDLKKSLLMGGAAGKTAVATLTGGNLGKPLGGGGPHEDVGQRAYISKMQDFQFSTRMASAQSLGAGDRSMIEARQSKLLGVYAAGTASAQGEDRLYQLREAFKGDTDMQKFLHGKNQKDTLMRIQEMEAQLKIPPERRLSESFDIPKLPELVGGGADHRDASVRERLGHGLLATSTSEERLKQVSDRNRQIAMAGGGMAGAMAPGGIGLFDIIADKFFNRAKDAQAQAAGALFDKKETRELAFGVLTGAEGANDRISRRLIELSGKTDDASIGERGSLQAIQHASAVMDVARDRKGVNNLTDEDWKGLAKKSGMSVEAMKAQFNTVRGGAALWQKEAKQKIAEQITRTTREEGEFIQAGGIANYKNGVFSLTETAEKSLMAKGGKGAVQAARLAMTAQTAAANIGPEGEGIVAMESANSDFMKAMSGLSTKEIRAVAGSLAGTSRGGIAAEAVMRGSAIDASKGKRGVGGAFAGAMGMDLTPEEMAQLKGAAPEQAARMLASKLGLGDDKNLLGGLTDAMKTASKKGGGAAGSILLSQTLQNDPEARKKLEELAKGKGSPEEKIIDKIGEGNNYLKALVQSNDAAKAQLAVIAGNTKDYSHDGEQHQTKK